MTNGVVSFQVLGPLEVHVAGEALAIGGAKQRAVLAVLLLRAGEVVSVERLVDEVWGDEPPPSAAHSLESYVSRLRQLFNGHGPRLVRRGAGYALELGDAATLDARGFVELQERASLAAAVDDHVEVVDLTSAALAMWRGPALADVALASTGRAEADRLEELRLRTYELRFDAELALGRHEQAIGELQKLVAQNPYRERFVAQLMLALYRSGRHAEALEIYEQTRWRLDSDLGLQPSVELQQLSGQIVRQEPELRNPVSPTIGAKQPGMTERGRRVPVLAIAGIVSALAVTLTASGGAASTDRPPPAANRLALVLPGSEETMSGPARNVSRGVSRAAQLHELDAQTLFVDDGDPVASATRAVQRVERGGMGLVVVLGEGPTARALAAAAPKYPETRFVFVDASLRALSLEKKPNVTALRFADEDTTYLAGYLSGIIPTRNELVVGDHFGLENGSKPKVDVVSVVAGATSVRTKRLIAGFRRGLRRANSRAEVRVAYSRSFENPGACERIANRHIDRGADLVLAVAGRCGLGALAVARTRGVWGVGAQDDGVDAADDHMLVVTYKEWDRVAFQGVEGLVLGTLPMGRELVLGLEDEYAAGFETSYEAPQNLVSLTLERCSEISGSRTRDNY